MIPDTTAYMIAGFSVVVGGIVLYVISLVVRNHRIQK
jgi:hypothetical protein